MRRTFNHRRWPRSANREEIAMTRIALAALALLAAMTLPAVAADYKIVERFKMPDGGWDYASSDPIKGLIYWSRNEGFTDVIDAKTGKLSQLKSTGNGHLAVPVAGTTLVVLPLRVPAKTIRIFDTATDKVVADVPGGETPDGATYDPFSKHVFVADRDPSEVTEVDPLAGKSTTFSVGGGKLEFPASDGLGRLFVNRSQAGEIAVIDIKTQKVTATYKMAGCDDPSGLAYADRSKLLVSSCNGLAKVLAAETGKEVASIPIGKGPDAVIYDAVRQLAFIPCGADGVLEIISLADPSHVALLQHLPTHILARTGAVDLQSGRVYLMSAEPDPSKPRGGGGRPTPKDGSFEMLVIGPQ
jgi:DNA-binding beta-propeller fold protein YncE